MEGTTMTRIRWFWAWQDEAEEGWLGAMAEKGWHLLRLGLPGFYTFVAGRPQPYAYRLDYRTENRRDLQSYLQLFRDAGWEHVGQMGGWQYFRKPIGPGEEPEIFSDAESKVAKYQRLLGTLVVFLPIFVILLRQYPEAPAWMLALWLVRLLVTLLYVYAVLMIIRRIGQLKKR